MDVLTAEYREMSAKSFNVKRNIPERAYCYYGAVLTYARMINLHAQNVGNQTYDEIELVRLVRQFRPPKFLSSYLAGFGNTDYTNGATQELFKMLKPVYDGPDVDEQGCFFGSIHEFPQKYANYLSLAVFSWAPQYSLEFTRRHVCGSCSNRIISIGYRAATELDRAQVATLAQC